MDFTPRISEVDLIQLLDAEEAGTITSFQLKVLNSLRWLHEQWRIAEEGVNESVWMKVHNGSEQYHPGVSNARVSTVARKIREAIMYNAGAKVNVSERSIENDYQEG